MKHANGLVMPPFQLLVQWLRQRLDGDQTAWLDEHIAHMQEGPRQALLFKAFNLVGRRLGKNDLKPTVEETHQATTCLPGWTITTWSVDQCGRLALLLALPYSDQQQWVQLLDDLCSAADVAELVTIYRGLPLYPFAEAHRARAAEGIRSNMKAVYEAVTHDNPYPAQHLDEDAWNQMVLKALFIGSRLAPIQQLDQRCNQALATMLIDYARERIAAQRPISPELWRCVAPFANDQAVDLLLGQLQSNDRARQNAAALALASSYHTSALTNAAPALAAQVAAGSITWDNFSEETTS